MTSHRGSNAGLLWGGLLIVLGAALLAETTGLIPGSASTWFGSAFLGAIGLVFLAVYAASTARWWALIPAGTLLSLAVVAAVGPFVPGPVGGAVFLFGLAVTFAAVAVAPAPRSPRTWALIPAGVLAVLAAVSLGSTPAAAVIWPAVLILAGAYLVVAWATHGRLPGG